MANPRRSPLFQTPAWLCLLVALAAPVAAVDIDGDGYEDLLLADPFDGTGGSVIFLPGAAAGFDEPGSRRIQAPHPNPVATFAQYTSISLAADLAGEDIVIIEQNAGLVFVVLDIGGGPPQVAAIDLDELFAPVGLAAGDFNGDGFRDYATLESRSARVTVFYSDGSRFDPVGFPLPVTAPGLDGVEPVTGETEGVAAAKPINAVLVAGRRNTDKFDDLIVGLPDAKLGSAAQAGQVLEYLGSKAGLKTKPNKTYRRGLNKVPGKPTAGERFGAQVALVNFDKKGGQNLIIGCPYCFKRTGAFYAEKNDRSFFVQTLGQANVPGSFFGWAFTEADLDGDAYPDFVVGAPGVDQGTVKNAGAIYGYRGGPASPVYATAMTVSSTLQQTTPLGFGAGLDAFDLMNAGTDQIFVGSPCFDLPGKARAGGIVPVILGSGVASPIHLDRGAIAGNAAAQNFLNLPNGSSLLNSKQALSDLCAGK